MVEKIVASARRLRAEPARRLTKRDDHGMGGRVVGLFDLVVRAGDHRFVDHGDGRDRSLAVVEGELRLRQCLAHEELVVHRGRC